MNRRFGLLGAVLLACGSPPPAASVTAPPSSAPHAVADGPPKLATGPARDPIPWPASAIAKAERTGRELPDRARMRLGMNFSDVTDVWFENNELRVSCRTSREPEQLGFPDARSFGVVHRDVPRDAPKAPDSIGARMAARSADGRWLAALGDGFIAVLDATKHAVMTSFPVGSLSAAKALAISNDGTRVATVIDLRDNLNHTVVREWDVTSGRPFEDPEAPVSAVWWIAHAGATIVAWEKSGGSLTTWDVRTRRSRTPIHVADGYGIWTVAVNDDGAIGVLGDHAVSLWRDGKSIASVTRPQHMSDRGWNFAFAGGKLSADGALLDVPSLSSTDPRQRWQILSERVVAADLTSYAFMLDPSGGAAPLVRWKPGRSPSPMGMQLAGASATAIDARGSVLVAEDKKQERFIVIDLEKKKIVRSFGAKDVALSQDGKILAYVDNHAVYAGPPLGSSPSKISDQGGDHVAISPDGSELAVAQLWGGILVFPLGGSTSTIE